MPLDNVGGVIREATTTVVLHGRLAKIYGRRHELGVKTAADAAYALCALHPGFRQDFETGYYKVIRGTVAKGMPLSEGMLTMRIGRAGEIHFVPQAKGAKSGGVGKIILGAVIVIASVAAAVATAGTSLAVELPLLGTVGVSLTSIAFFGASILLAGISQAISPQAKNNAAAQVDPMTSFGLSGPTNSTQQGSTVPAVYGRMRVGSVVGSFGYEAVDYSGSVTDATASPPIDTSGALLGSGLGSGGGGKGGSSSGGAHEAPNTLRSNALVRVIDILSEGPIGGLVDGAKSIFFNNTPLMASDGTYNFKGVSWEVRLGYPDQDPVTGYPAAEETITLSAQVKQLQPKIQTINSSTANAARVTIRIPALVTQNTTNGNLEAGQDLDYKFEVRPIGGAWSQVVLEHIAGQKTTSAYQRSYRFDLPNVGIATSWDIRMTRITPDSTTSNVQNDTYWDTITVITDHRLIYPGTAYIALTIDASAFGSQIPTRAYEIDGILCQVPLNYDAAAHTYATTGPGTSMGTWDGASWKVAPTSNPCWCLYDMLSNPRYGLGLPASALSSTRYDLFTISQYCDGFVPTGYKDVNGNDTSELRYAMNVAMTTQDDAYRVLQSMVSTFRGMTYWGAGRVCVTADMPTVPSSLMSQANVIEGDFNYEGTPLKTRHTVARVAWQDPQNSYLPTIEVVEDFDQVVTLGQVATDIHAFGCTSRGLAHRLGKWLLDTEKTQTDTLTCRVGMDQVSVRPGDVVRVSDPHYAGFRMAGRCAGGSTTTRIKLDSVFPTSGELYYSVTITLPDGTVVDKAPVAGIGLDGSFNGPNNILTMVSPLPMAPAVDATWLLSSEGTQVPHGPAGLYPIVGREFRVLALAEPQRGVFTVAAVNHDPNKFARVEYGLKFDPTPYSALGQLLVAPLPAPTNVVGRDYIAGVGTTTLVRATVSFTAANDPRVTGAEVRAVGPQQAVAYTTGASADFDNLQLGTYVFGVRSTGRDGRTSVWVDSDPVTVDGVADAPTAVTGFTAVGGAMQVRLTWNATSARDLLNYEIWRAPSPQNGTHPFPTGSFTPSGTPAANNATKLVSVNSTSYTDSGDVLGPDQGWAYWVRPINTTLVPGGFAGPVKAVTTYYLTDNLSDAIKNTAVYAQQLLGSAPTIVDSLPATGSNGQLVFNKTDQKLYKWDASLNGGSGGWYTVVALIPDSTGKIPASIVSGIEAAVIGQSLTQAQIQQVIDSIGAATITSDKITSLVGSKVTGLLPNAQIMAGRVYDVDPVTGATVQGVNITNVLGNLAETRITHIDPASGNPVAGVSAANLVGTINTAAIPTIPTSKLAGDVLASSSATLNLSAAGVTGTLSAAKLVDVDPSTGNTVAGINAAKLLGTIDSSKLGTVPVSLLRDVDPLTNTQISGLHATHLAGQVVASQIYAGAITAEKLAIGSPDNFIGNPCFSITADGWAPYSGCTFAPIAGSPNETSWTPRGTDGGVFIQGPGTALGAEVDLCAWSPNTSGTQPYGASIPVTPGKTYEAQIRFITLAGSMQLLLLFTDDTQIVFSPRTSYAFATPPANGNSIGDWQAAVVRGVAPANAKYATILIRMQGRGPGVQGVSCFITQTLLGEQVPNATSPLTWVAGGVTSIGGGMIRSNAIIARNILAGVITGDKMTANSIGTRELTVGNGSNLIWNSCLAVSTDGWSAASSVAGQNPPIYSTASNYTAYATIDGCGVVETALPAGAYVDTRFVPIDIQPGDWIEAQAMVLPVASYATMYVEFFDGTGAHISYSGQPNQVSSQAIPSASARGSLAPFSRISLIVQAPANAYRVSLVIRWASPQPGESDGFGVFTRVGLGKTVAGATQVSAWAPGGLTSISGGLIKTNAIVARNVAAGAISAEKLAIASASNVIGNPTCQVRAWGWRLTASAPGAVIGSTLGDSIATSFGLAGEGAGCLYASSMSTSQILAASWSPDNALGIPCIPGEWWEVQGYLGAHRCYACVQISFWDIIGNDLADTAGARVVVSGGPNLTDYGFSWTKAQAPLNAAFVRLTVLGLNDNGADILRGVAGQVPYVFFTRMVLGRSTPVALSVSQPQPYQIGGTTQIVGGQIATDAITARNILAGEINAKLVGANQINAGNIAAAAITTEKLAVGSPNNLIGNSCFYVSGDGWAGDTTPTPVVGSAYEADYSLEGLGAGLVAASGLAPNATSVIYYNAGVSTSPRAFGCSVVCSPGETWEAQVAVIAVTFTVELLLLFADNSGNLTAAISSGVRPASTSTDGRTLDKWNSIAVRGTAPAGTTACGMLIQFRNTGSSAASGGGFVTRTLLGKTVPNATSNLPWTPGGVVSIGGGMLQSNAVIARHITAGQIKTAAIDAGAITGEKLAIGSATNVVWNPSCVVTTDGWVAASASVPVALISNYPGYTPTGEGSGTLAGTGTLASGQNMAVFWTPLGGAGVPVIAGQWVEAQALLAAHRCAGRVNIAFFDVNGNALGGLDGGRVVGKGGGPALSSYGLSWCKAQAPANAVTMRLGLYAYNDGGSDFFAVGGGLVSGQAPYLFFTRALLGNSTPVPMAQSQPQVWAPGGVTEITGGVIKTDTIVSRNILAGAITGEKLSIGSGANVIWNSCCPISMDGWTVVQSGTLGSISPATTQHNLKGFGAGAIYNNGGPVNGTVQAAWAPASGVPGIPCQTGQVWEAQAKVISAGCSAQIVLDFFDGVGVFNGRSLVSASTGGPTDPGTNVGVLSEFTQLSMVVTAPANSFFVRMSVRMLAILDVGAQVYFTQTMLAQTVANATQVSLWAPGGVSTITGGLITTNAITSRVIAANQITTEKLAVGNSTNLITNSCCAIATDGWTATAGNFYSTAVNYQAYATTDGCGALETSLASNATVDVYWSTIDVQSGDWVEAQAMLLPIGSTGMLFLDFFDGNRSHIGYSPFSTTVSPQPTPTAPAIGTLAPFTLAGLICQAPAGAAFVRFLVRFQNLTGSPTAGLGFFTRAGLGKTVPGATQISSWAPGGITSIDGGIIKTNAIVARNVAAGAITGEKLAIASASNVIGNPTCPSTSWGWVVFSNAGNARIGSVIGDGMAPAGFSLAGEGTGCVNAPTMGVGQSMLAYWDPDSTGGVICSAGEWWEAQAYLATHRCAGYARLEFWSATAMLLAVGGNRISGSTLGGVDLAGYGFSWIKAQAPVGTIRVKMVALGVNDGNADITAPAGSNPYIFFTRCVLGRSTATPYAQSQPQPYQIGGVTQISGGQIKTGAIVARSIGAGAVTAEKVSVGSVTNVITNSCGNPTAAGWSAGVQTALPNTAYGLDGYGSAFANLASQSSGAYADYWWAPQGVGYLADGTHTAPYDPTVPVVPGDLWEAQVKVLTHRCSVNLFLIFVAPRADGSGFDLISAPSSGDQAWLPSTGGKISDYHQVSVRGTVPAGATLCTLMLRMSNSPTSQAIQGDSGVSPYLFWTQAGLGPALPNVALMPWGPGGVSILSGGQIQTGTILAQQIGANQIAAVHMTANSITANSLAAQSVTAEKAAFGSPSNVIWNSCPDQGCEGWTRFTAGPSMPAYGDPNVLMGEASRITPSWALQLYGSAFTQYIGSGQIYNNQYLVWDWRPSGDATLGVPAAAGATYGAAALLITGNGGSAFVQMLFIDGNNNVISTFSSDAVLNNAGPGAGGFEAYYIRKTVVGIAPSGTASVLLRIILTGSATGSSQPFMAWSKAQIGQMANGSTVVGPWSPGGVTTIDGGMIRTQTLNANRINVGTIAAAAAFIQTLTATTVTTTNIKAQLVGTNRLDANQINADTLTVGAVRAGAIGADQIAAGQLHAYHLAADFILASSAQIGLATIGTAQIQDLSVNGEKITSGAVTSTGTGTTVINGTPPGDHWIPLLYTFVERRTQTQSISIFVKSINDFYTDTTYHEGVNGSDGA